MKKKEHRPQAAALSGRPVRPSRRLQHLQLAAHRASRGPVIVHLLNGTRLSGIVMASDNYMVLLGEDLQDASPLMIYKHSISVITPASAPHALADAPDPKSSPEFVPLYIPRTRKRR